MAVSLNRASGQMRRPRRTGQVFSEINVTPFVDVMLVLLVIFMVTAPMLTVGVPVDLPKTKAARMNDQAEPLVISVDAQGKSYLQEMELEGDALIERLIAVSGNNPDAKIYVRGDQKINYGRVMEIMGVIAAAGFSKVSLIAEMPSGADKGKKLTVRKATPGLAASVPSAGQFAPHGMPPALKGAIPQGSPRLAVPQVMRSPGSVHQQGMRSAPLSQVRVKSGVTPKMPVIRTLNPAVGSPNGPKIIRGQ
jgi:biopolymer transport protein TolR